MSVCAISSTFPCAERELELLQSLWAQLAAAGESLMQGDVRDVPVICGQIAATAQELSALALPLASLPGSPDAHRKRRKLLLDIRQQCAFSRAILRRWRRSMMARQQLLEMRMPATTYSEPSRPAMEP